MSDIVYTGRMVNVPSDRDPAEDATDERAFVERLIGHMAQPCGTDEGNLRSFYIREAEAALAQGKVSSPHHRAMREGAIRMAKRLKDAEGG